MIHSNSVLVLNINYQNIWLVDVETQSSTKLTTGTAQIRTPRISPDKQQIAFSMQSTSGEDIFIMPLLGGEKKQLTYLAGSNYEIDWSPDGTQLAFGLSDKGNRRVWSLNLQNERIQTFEETVLANHVIWVNNTDILYQLPENRNFSILDTETQLERRLVSNDSVGWMFNPAVSPDGKHVAVYWNRTDREKGIWIISLEEGSPQLVRSFENFVDGLRPLKWSTDGQWIYAIYESRTPQEIVRVSRNGEELQFIATVLGSNTYDIDMSSDGKHIVASLPEAFSDIWIIEGFDQ